MNREPVRSPARSVANVEFHGTGDQMDKAARKIVAALERQGLRAVIPPMAFPMEADRWPGKIWVVSHKPIAVAVRRRMPGGAIAAAAPESAHQRSAAFAARLWEVLSP